MIPVKYSIAAVSKVIPTNGSNPVVIMVDDLNDYICKYGYHNKLVNEYLAFYFLSSWELPVIPAAIVIIDPEHIPASMISNRLQPRHFHSPTFGLQYMNEYLDVSNLLLGLSKDYGELNKFANKYDLLKIALFDLWLANTDRNHNNYNLLINPAPRGYTFHPIDHTDIFDGGRIGQQLAQLTEFDSLLSSDLANIFALNKRKTSDYVNNLILKFPIFVRECGNHVDEIVSEIPPEWCDDKESLKTSIISSIIKNDIWIDDTLSNFQELIHKYIC
ncbi:MAG: HipA family kinase [Daejeonella sp.]